MPDSPQSKSPTASNGLDRQESTTSLTSRTSAAKSPKERLQRQISLESSRRLRTVSQGAGSTSGRVRTDSVSSYSRRPSLSLGHADALPLYLEKPAPEEVPPEEGRFDNELHVFIFLNACSQFLKWIKLILI